MRTHYGPWQPCWISNQHQKHNSGRGPSSEHFWQVWLISVQRFQRRRFKCEKLTDGRTTTHDKSSHGLWPGELKRKKKNLPTCTTCTYPYLTPAGRVWANWNIFNGGLNEFWLPLKKYGSWVGTKTLALQTHYTLQSKVRLSVWY